MYYISFEICAFLLSLFCFAYCLLAKHRQYVPPRGIRNKLNNQHFLFLVMLLSNMLSSVSSVTGVFLTSVNAEGIAFWQYFFHALYFIFHTTLSVAFGLYIMSVTGTTFGKKRWLSFLFFVPYIVACVLILTNHWTNWAFYMDAERVYHRGSLMILLYGLGALYLVLGFVFFIKNMKAISKVDRIAVGTFIVIATLGIVVQAVRSDWLVELFFEALACLVMMMVLEDRAGHIDPATGLFNRTAFLDESRRLMVTKQTYEFVLLKIAELDRFTKRFNGRASEALLLKIAAYLNEASGSGAVYSLHREEFAVIFKEPEPGQGGAFAQALIDRFQKEWTVDSIEIVLEVIATVFHVPQDISAYPELEDLMGLNYVKNKAGSYLVPQSEIVAMAKERRYEEVLRHALNNHGFRVKYQPIWSISKGVTVSAEALIRVEDEELRNISPEDYIPIAEKSGLIRDIGLFVFEEVCRFLSDERGKGTSIKYIELNLSTYQFLYGDLVQRFEEIRTRYGVPSDRINLEITETAGALGRKEVVEALERFRALGYSLSLDDFGTGYSNFVRMIKLKFENIKIDKSILWDLGKEEGGIAILKNLMLFIKNQGSTIIQEGVETKEQLDLVIDCGCDYVQGFYFSEAISQDEFFEYLKKEACQK